MHLSEFSRHPLRDPLRVPFSSELWAFLIVLPLGLPTKEGRVCCYYADGLDDRQITHLICVRLKHFLYDFLGGVWGLLPVVFLYKRHKTPPKSHIDNVLGGHRIDEQSGGLGVVFPTFRLSIISCVFDRVKLIETD